MAWTESHQELAHHPKTKKLKRLLSIGTAQAVGHLHLLWWWALDYAQDGNLAPFEGDVIADACEWEHDPDVLVDALIQAGFVDADMHIHDWDQYGGKFIKERERGRARQRKRRASFTRDAQESNAEVTRDSAGSSRVEKSTGEKRREEVSKPPVSHPPGRGAYTQEFEQFWKPYPPTNGSKADAFKAWKQLSVEERALAVRALPTWLACDRWREGYVKHAGSWLRGRMWEVAPANGRASPNGKARALSYYDDPEELRLAKLESERQRAVWAARKQGEQS